MEMAWAGKQEELGEDRVQNLTDRENNLEGKTEHGFRRLSGPLVGHELRDLAQRELLGSGPWPGRYAGAPSSGLLLRYRLQSQAARVTALALSLTTCVIELQNFLGPQFPHL